MSWAFALSLDFAGSTLLLNHKGSQVFPPSIDNVGLIFVPSLVKFVVCEFLF